MKKLLKEKPLSLEASTTAVLNHLLQHLFNHQEDATTEPSIHSIEEKTTTLKASTLLIITTLTSMSIPMTNSSGETPL